LREANAHEEWAVPPAPPQHVPEDDTAFAINVNLSAEVPEMEG